MKAKRIIRWGIVTALACGVFGCHVWIQSHPPKRSVQRFQALNMVRNVAFTLPSGRSTNFLDMLRNVTLTLPSGGSNNNLSRSPELRVMGR